MFISQTPLRISFVGGGTDFREFYVRQGGAVVSSAIDKYIFVIVKERFDDKIVINYSKKEIVDRVDEIQHELVRETMRKTGVERGVEITTLADIPSEGTGLGSSSTVTVGLLNALYAYTGWSVSAETLAVEACRIEIDILGKPIGKQDQYIAAYGGLRHIRFGTDDVVEAEPISVTEETLRLFSEQTMLFFTGIQRSSSTILADQRENIPDREAVLCRMRDQATEARVMLEAGSIDGLGPQLQTAWDLKKQLSDKVSNDSINDLYQRALEAGAAGGKISGAGGGGFLLLVCPHEKKESVRQALTDLTELHFALERDGSKMIFNVRR